MEGKWTGWHTLGLVLIIVAIALIGFLIPVQGMLLAWLLTMGLLTLFTMVASGGITGRFLLGWLINEQNRMSLSRLQMFLWTVVVLSALLTAALFNMKAGFLDNAVAIAIPEQVWIAMGISTVSLVGSPLILKAKMDKETNKQAAEKTTSVSLLAGRTAEQRESTIEEHSSGQLDRKVKPQDARLYDLFSGEEVGNRTVLDLTRLQNLFFTLILLGSYAAALGSLLFCASGKAPYTAFSKFPGISDGQLALLGISHAGYLASKAVDKQPEAIEPIAAEEKPGE